MAKIAGIPGGFESDEEFDEYGFSNSGYADSSTKKSGMECKNRSQNFRDPSPVSKNGHPLLSASPHLDLQKKAEQGVKIGDLVALKECLASNNIVVDQILDNDWTLLMCAANEGQAEIVKFLLSKGANPNFHQHNLYTVLMAACQCTKKEESEVLKCVELLVEKGAIPAAFDRFHMTALIFAAQSGFPEVCEYLAGMRGVDVNVKDSRDWTALMWATDKKHLPTIAKLLELGADPKLVPRNGMSALEMAKANKSKKLLAVFCEAGFPASDKTLIEGVVPTEVSVPHESAMRTGKTIANSRHNQLDIFLGGIDLRHLLPTFQQQQVTYKDLLLLNGKELQDMGISELGIRKKILEAVKATMHKPWEKGSLISVTTPVTRLPESIAAINNIKEQLERIHGSLQWFMFQFIEHPHILEGGDSSSNAEKLRNSVIQLHHTLPIVEDITSKLHNHMDSVSGYVQHEIPDLISKKQRPKHRRWTIGGAALITIGVAAAAYFLNFKN